MADTEILLREEGSPRVAQLCNLRPLFRRLEGFERHRVLTWLNCCPQPPDFRVPKAARSPDDSFNRFLRIFFLLVLSLGVIKTLYEESVIDNLPSPYSFIPKYSPFSNFYVSDKIWLIYLLCWSGVVVLVMLVAVAACIVKKKMKKMEFTPPRKEEVKTISGLIQQV